MAETDEVEESCENCAFLTSDDVCGNAKSVYHGRPSVYRDGDEVVQAAWCECWAPAAQDV